MLGIECKWECPACGNLIRTASPFWNKVHRKNIEEPKRCGCGRKSGFMLIGFKPCQFEVRRDDEDKDNEQIEENLPKEELKEASIEA